MPRPKIHDIDPDKILWRIHKLTLGRIAEIDSELIGLDGYSADFQRLHRERRQLKSDGCDYRTESLAGRVLKPAERRAWQRAVAELERLRLVEIIGVRGSAIRLSAKGKKHLKEISGNEKKQN